MIVPRTQRSAQHLRSGALQSLKRVYARLRGAMAPVCFGSKKEETGVPVLRSGMKNAAARQGYGATTPR